MKPVRTGERIAHDLAEVDLEWRIDLAKKGDGGPLAKWLLSDNFAPRKILLAFFAGVVTGKIKLKRPRKLTYELREQRHLRERYVVLLVDHEMRLAGKQRDRNLRTKLTRKWCDRFDTTPNRVESYLRHPRRPRRASDPR
jgi:hypothetical protein